MTNDHRFLIAAILISVALILRALWPGFSHWILRAPYNPAGADGPCAWNDPVCLDDSD